MSDTVHVNEDEAQSASPSTSQNVPEPRESVGDQDDEYYMNRKAKKVAVIVNNTYPKDLKTGYPERIGANVDYEKIKELLSELAFGVEDSPDSKIIVENNLTLDEMRSLFERVSKEETKDAICLVVVVMSYGQTAYSFGIDRRMRQEDLERYFITENCPNLAGKPKLFFLQTCSDYNRGGVVQVETREPPEIQPQSDILRVQSLIPGALTWSSNSNDSPGSMFISALTDVMRSNWRELDVETMLNQVDERLEKEMKEKVTRFDCDFTIKSSLKKKMYFK